MENMDAEKFKDFATFPLVERMKYLGKFAVVACMNSLEHSLTFKCGTVTNVSPYHIGVSGVKPEPGIALIYFLGDTREEVINAATIYYDTILSNCYDENGAFYYGTFMEEVHKKVSKYVDLVIIA